LLFKANPIGAEGQEALKIAQKSHNGCDISFDGKQEK
jgi:hypothetical protein